MGPFSKSRQAGPPLPVIVADPSLGDPLLGGAVAAARRGDSAAVAQHLASTRDEVHRYLLVDEMCEHTTDDPSWLTTWLEAHPDDVGLRAIHGTLLVHQAWAVRSSRRANEVSDDQFERFFATLRQAETVLTGALRDDPTSGVAWVALLNAARGLQLSRVECDDLFAQCEANVPMFLPAYKSYLQYLCAKWFGSYEDALAFARWAASRAPVGHPAHALVAVAHFEHSEEIDPAQRPAAIAEVRHAAEQSRLTSPDWGNDPYGIELRNGIAAAASDLGDYELARYLLQIAGPRGDRASRFPWAYYGDAAQSFAEAGRRCGAW